jgi:signal transduction histidine kinase
MTNEKLPAASTLRDRLERLTNVTRSAASAPELEPWLQSVIAAASELTGSEAAAILEYDEQDKSLRCLAVPPIHQAELRGLRIPVDETPAGWAIQEQQPLRIPRARMTAGRFSGADFTLASPTHCLVAVPLMLRGKALGALEAFNKSEVDYTEEDVTILETLAASVALALDHNTLRHRIESSFSELSDLDRLKTDFIAITSHELRTPLGVILGHATYLRELVDEPFHEQLDIIIKNAARLKEIVESLASIDNYKTGTARLRQHAVSMRRVIEEVTASCVDMAAKGNITLNSQSDGDEVFVEADETKLSIALGNLVKNAIAFTDDGGHVLIKSETLPGYVKVSVIDDGVGIPIKDLPRIFERFFQVETHLTRRHNGMGLGLSVAKAMIEMHGGRIWVESIEGKGSNFSFLLPVQAAEAKASQVLLP